MRSLVLSSVLVLLALIPGCKPREQAGRIGGEIKFTTTDNRHPAVGFGIQPEQQNSNVWRYKASYTRNGKTARFGIELRPEKKTSSEPGAVTGVGSFIADPRSDSSVLLTELQELLKASQPPSHDIRVRELPFQFVITGQNLDRGPNGDVVDSATGDWVRTRLFLGPQQDKEIQFNFQKSGGTGEFLVADPKIGDAVLHELAKVL